MRPHTGRDPAHVAPEAALHGAKLWLPARAPLRRRKRSGNVAGHSVARRPAGASTCQKTP